MSPSAKGAFLSDNKTKEFDLISIDIDEATGLLDLKFSQINRATKTTEPVGEVTIPWGMANIVWRHMNNYRKNTTYKKLSPLELWRNYYEATKNHKPSPLLIKALSLVTKDNCLKALDLGCGAGADCKYLLTKGFRVTGVDNDFIANEYLSKIKSKKMFFVNLPFNLFNFPPDTYNLVVAQYSLPFNPPSTFETIISKTIASLKAGGVFAGHFFGLNDEWAKAPGMTFVSKQEAYRLLSPLEILEFREEEKDGKTATGTTKHWHLFHFIAKK